MNARLLVGVAVVLGLAGAFVAGRFSAPEQVTYVESEEVVSHQAATITLVMHTETVKNRVKVVDRIVKPDGTVHEHTEEREAEHTKTDSNAAATEVKEVSEKKTISEKTVTRPDWRVSVLAGASIREPLLPVAGPLVLGAQVDRRIVGGLSLGVWANTAGAAGLAVSLEF